MSPCFIRLLTPAGLRPVAYQAESLAEAARFEPHDGVYTITNTFNTFDVLKLDSHLDRLQDSARREGISLPLDRRALRAALRGMIAECGFGDVRFRITAPRAAPDTLILSLEPFTPLGAETYANGVRCITLPGSARHRPESKTTDWMHDRERFQLPPGVFTGLLLDSDGNILEGLSSNFYAVLNGELRTAGAGVLAGIARQIVLEVAPAILPIRQQAVHLSDLPVLGESFITSSSRGIVPVVEIDGQPIGEGRRRKFTALLQDAYNAWVRAHLEPL